MDNEKKKELTNEELKQVTGGENEDYFGQNPAKFHGFHVGDRVSVLANPLGQGVEPYCGTITGWSLGNGKQFDRTYGGYAVFPIVNLDKAGEGTFMFYQLTKL